MLGTRPHGQRRLLAGTARQQSRRSRGALVVRGTFFVAFDYEFGKQIREFARSQQERVPLGTPAELLLISREGLVEHESARRDERFEPRAEGPVQIAKDQHGAEAPGLEWREASRFEVGAKNFDLAHAAVARTRLDLGEHLEEIGIAIDRDDTEPEVGRGEGVATTTTGQVERRTDPDTRRQSRLVFTKERGGRAAFMDVGSSGVRHA